MTSRVLSCFGVTAIALTTTACHERDTGSLDLFAAASAIPSAGPPPPHCNDDASCRPCKKDADCGDDGSCSDGFCKR